MARRKRRRQQLLGHLTKDIVLDLQDSLDSIASAEHAFKIKGQAAAARRERAKLDGALEAAEAIGAYCQCFPVTKTLNQCACGTTLPAMTGRTQSRRAMYQSTRAGSRELFTLSGKGCRDSQGRFVPVAQCKGPVGRDAGGRFVSLK